MEHRWSRRKPIEIDVLIYRDNVPAAWCKSCDLSLEGVSIKSRRLQFAKRATLDVELILKLAGQTHCIRLPARVAYTRGGLTGLMFAETGFKTRGLLRRAVYDDIDSELFSAWSTASLPTTS